jgi:uncharacterized membrane protein
MLAQQQRPLLMAVAAILVAWVVAIAGYTIAKNSKMTAEKVRTFAQSVDLNRLSGEARARAIRELAGKLNKLSPEERRKARFERSGERWFEQMTEDEKGTFIELTMPTGFKQMLSSFEEMPEEKRRRAIGDALKRLKEEQEKIREEGEGTEGATNAPPVLSKELQEKITKIGLKTYYSESSAQTKAEMAPLLEELQRIMESGRMFRGGR